MIERNHVYNADCMLGMAEMPDNYVDWAFVDPPYNVKANDGTFGRGGKRAIIPEARDEFHKYGNADAVPDENYFKELFRVSANQVIFGANYYAPYIPSGGLVVWDKVKEHNEVLSDAEIAYQSKNKLVKMFRHQWVGFLRAKGSIENGITKTIHPNQKPVALYKWLLKNYAKPGDLILDTHVGSGSSIIACIDKGYDYIGYEIDADYYKAMQERVYQFTRQTALSFDK